MNDGRNTLALSIALAANPNLNSSFNLKKEEAKVERSIAFVGIKNGENITVKNLFLDPKISPTIENILSCFFTYNHSRFKKIMSSNKIFLSNDNLYLIDKMSVELKFINALNPPKNTILFYMDNFQWYVLSGFPEAKADKPVKLRNFFLEFYSNFYPEEVSNKVKENNNVLCRVYSVSETAKSEIFHLEPISSSHYMQGNFDVIVKF